MSEPGAGRPDPGASDDESDGVERSGVDGDRADRHGAGEDGASGDAIEEDGTSGDATDEDGADEGPSLAGILGGRPDDAPPRPEVRPESVSPENAAFVLLGVLFALYLVYRTAAVLAV